jgi:hypothetical protein
MELYAKSFAESADRNVAKTNNTHLFSSLLSNDSQLYYHMIPPSAFVFISLVITGLKPAPSSGKNLDQVGRLLLRVSLPFGKVSVTV